MRMNHWIISQIVVSLLLATCAMAVSADPIEFKVDKAVFLKAGEPAQPEIMKNTFGPGSDAIVLPGTRGIRSELRYSCKDLPEGDYYIGLLMIVPWPGYFGMSEGTPGRVQIYLNDTRLAWTSHTEPLRPENAAEKKSYQAEMRLDSPIHIKPDDVLRIALDMDGDRASEGMTRMAAGQGWGGY